MRLGFELEGGKYKWIINKVDQKVILKPRKKSKIIFGWDKKIKLLNENKYLLIRTTIGIFITTMTY